ncbi:MAG: DUF4197 domain-containing protein [Bacteroidales bacterium]|nr:DUF4197 domain-containing protein [Bacteroidales bacterium]
MKKLLLPVFMTLFMLVSSCDFLGNLGLDTTDGISKDEVVKGLKTALEIGTDTATSRLAVENGYYQGHPQFIRIPLPEEAEAVRVKLTSSGLIEDFASVVNLDLDEQFEKVILAVNRAAEHAADNVFPIFKNAIDSLSLEDAWDILNGIVPGGEKSTGFDSTAATEYFRLQTYNNLLGVYLPIINEALSKDLGLGFSANEAWYTLTSKYNTAMKNTLVKGAVFAYELLYGALNLPATIDTDLSGFSCRRALNGLFYRVGVEEGKIREDPYKWADDIIQKVFGYIQDNYDPNYVAGSM